MLQSTQLEDAGMERGGEAVSLAPESGLARLLERAGAEGKPLFVTVGRKAYRLDVSSAVSSSASGADRALNGGRSTDDVMAFAGIWSDLDDERMIEELHRARHEAPR
jgi:hypothetical protein